MTLRRLLTGKTEGRKGGKERKRREGRREEWREGGKERRNKKKRFQLAQTENLISVKKGKHAGRRVASVWNVRKGVPKSGFLALSGRYRCEQTHSSLHLSTYA